MCSGHYQNDTLTFPKTSGCKQRDGLSDKALVCIRVHNMSAGVRFGEDCGCFSIHDLSTLLMSVEGGAHGPVKGICIAYCRQDRIRAGETAFLQRTWVGPHVSSISPCGAGHRLWVGTVRYNDQPLSYGRGSVRTTDTNNVAVFRGDQRRWLPFNATFSHCRNVGVFAGCYH
jgi:hypothetical protein